jgi:hypothetical protein
MKAHRAIEVRLDLREEPALQGPCAVGSVRLHTPVSALIWGNWVAALWSELGYWLPESPPTKSTLQTDEQQGTRSMVGVDCSKWKILYGHVPMGTFKAAYLRDVPTSKARE